MPTVLCHTAPNMYTSSVSFPTVRHHSAEIACLFLPCAERRDKEDLLPEFEGHSHGFTTCKS